MIKRVAILVHEQTKFKFFSLSKQPKTRYLISQLAQYWKESGIKVRFINDPGQKIEADILFLHVDLSIVPEAYLALAKSYPASVNARVKDIRKSIISRNILAQGDAWDGAVIVKTDLNYSGLPEKILTGSQFTHSDSNVDFAFNYPVFKNLREVPCEYFANKNLLVERFLPEMKGDSYCIRSYNFFGDRSDTYMVYSDAPVIRLGNITGMERIEAHPKIEEIRHSLGFDYGKFDYVIRDGEPILFDANKTIGHLSVESAEMATMLRRRADGIYSLVK